MGGGENFCDTMREGVIITTILVGKEVNNENREIGLFGLKLFNYFTWLKM